MRIFHTIKDLQNTLKLHNSSILGFVPTMGALHNGHLQLVKKAKKLSDVVIVSIFVNPTQFNNPEDFAKYPNTLSEDIEKLKSTGCDILFAPNSEEMYPNGFSNIKFDFGNLERVMEGKFRPGHFSGVGVVVSKLFNIVKPNKVFFGQKDYQQCAVIKQLIADLNFDLEMYTCPTVRETSGLAMSSRNMRLSEIGKNTAANIYRILKTGEAVLKETLSVELSLESMQNELNSTPEITQEYLEIVNPKTLESQKKHTDESVICFAGFVEGIRLIDNIVVKND